MKKEILTARSFKISPEDILRELFKKLIQPGHLADAVFTNSRFKNVIGIAPLPVKAPFLIILLKNTSITDFIYKNISDFKSLLFLLSESLKNIQCFCREGKIVKELDIPLKIKKSVIAEITQALQNAGSLNQNGAHEIDLKLQSPGPHFSVNLLIGNRTGFPNALQTTPKSVVDKFGRGSFRSHAAVQILATRYDMRQEENGFPANRQFYILENSKKIFYSANIQDENFESGTCIHSQNYTQIKYRTRCALDIERTIFLLPQYNGLPMATEVQEIEIKNMSRKIRRLKIITTGMFGSAKPVALQEDVLYSNIIVQSKILRGDDGSILAVGDDYYPEEDRSDLRFHTMIIHNGKSTHLAREFCTDYNEFVGNGTLENPEGALILSNRLSRKGPPFFALAGEIKIKPGEKARIDTFTGMVSEKANPNFYASSYKEEISRLINYFSRNDSLAKAFQDIKRFQSRYCGFLQVSSSNALFNSFFNKNLPFQVFYQTFTSRSFCQTQKGYREIGFREIQDIFASMYYFVSMGMENVVRDLLSEWAANIFEFGYAYHNFFWKGKEPGKWSDDALWFIQAVYRYVILTGDLGFLNTECPVAGTVPVQKRSIYKTIQAVIHYSGVVSTGKHGLPLLDSADWNDTLKLDEDYINGPEKEIIYQEQIKKDGNNKAPFKSNYSESVMNAFLLKVAVDEMLLLSKRKKDTAYHEYLKNFSDKLKGNIQKHAWKGDFFARVLFNRYPDGEYAYLGAEGDGLSADPHLKGVYLINSFSWAILSGTATEEQVRIMLPVFEKALKTPYGLKLMTPAALDKVSKSTAAGHYFPGDRENGGVFKHASMMAAAALLKAAKESLDKALAVKLSSLAYWMIDLVMPYKTLENPYQFGGNPRFCTQYTNSETGENIGPLLSGTATWLSLALFSAFGLEYTSQGIDFNPILREDDEILSYNLKTGKSQYKFIIKKPKGFYRTLDNTFIIKLDRIKKEKNIIPLFNDGKKHIVELVFN